MASISMKKQTGADAGTVELDDKVFGIQPNVPVMHQVVTAQLAGARSGTQSTKTRAEVRGGGAKPWKQKGTGRARAGSSRSPAWTGGGVALGPKPRKYDQKTPKKMIRLALLSALSDRAADNKVLVVSGWGLEAPSTKAAKALLEAIGASGKALVVVGADEILAAKSFRNLPDVHVLLDTELNAYDVLCSDVVVFTPETLPKSGHDQPVSVATTAPAAPVADDADDAAPTEEAEA
jgi:large subunit ribosomal protein L4